jgi:gluconolactonase
MMKFPICIFAVLAVVSASIMRCSRESEDIHSIFAPGAEIVRLGVAQDFTFLEGPAWDGEESLYFTDVPVSRIYRYTPEKGFSVFRENTDQANGLMFDPKGRLVACEGGSGRVTVMNKRGEVVEIRASEYRGMPFNSPNDLVIDKNGGIYFTDPNFDKVEDLSQNSEAVYYVRPDGDIVRVIEDIKKPNGIILSPDGSRLYVADSYDVFVRAYRMSANGIPVDRYIFATLKSKDEESDITWADGMTVDSEGHLYVATELGIQIFNRKGVHLGILNVPETPSNCTIGGRDGKTLYITARKSLYAIKLDVKGTHR